MVAHTLSFSKAAEVFHVSQPALSANIRLLEESLKAPLFVRTTRSVELTSAGQEFARVSRKILSELDSAQITIHDLIEGKQGRLRLAASPSVMAGLLPSALMRFTHDFPLVAIEVREESHERCVDLVQAAKVDMAITPHKFRSEKLIQEPLFEDSLVCICSPDHALAAQTAVEWKQLIREPLIVVKPNSSVRQMLERVCERYGAPLTPAYEVDRATSVISFVSAGLGVSLMPLSLIRHVNPALAVHRPLASDDARRIICSVHSAERPLSPVAAQFLRICRSLVEQRKK